MAKIRIIKNKATIVHEWRIHFIISVILNVILITYTLKQLYFQ